MLPRVANASVGISVIGEDQLGVLAAHGNQRDIRGTLAQLSPRATETMTSAMHALAANPLANNSKRSCTCRNRSSFAISLALADAVAQKSRATP
nr:hypothetical protein [Xanthomonas phaseoli]